MKHIDKLFKERLYNHEAEVPEGMWEKIAPIAEEESGRALLWFWFAGILTLLLGGYGIYKLITTSNETANPNALVFESESINQSTDILVDNSLLTESNPQKHNVQTIDLLSTSTSSNVAIEESLDHPATKKQKMGKPLNKNEETKQDLTVSQMPIISNTVENIVNVGGVPANLVITKSYVNKEGSVIKQSNISEESGYDAPIYDVIINSEEKDLNAGTLLRLIEPLENIPLPAFQKELKKKTPDLIIL